LKNVNVRCAYENLSIVLEDGKSSLLILSSLLSTMSRRVIKWLMVQPEILTSSASRMPRIPALSRPVVLISRFIIALLGINETIINYVRAALNLGAMDLRERKIHTRRLDWSLQCICIIWLVQGDINTLY